MGTTVFNAGGAAISINQMPVVQWCATCHGKVLNRVRCTLFITTCWYIGSSVWTITQYLIVPSIDRKVMNKLPFTRVSCVSLSLDRHPMIYPQIQFTRKQEWEECYNIIGSFSDYLTYVHDNTSLHMHCTFETSYKRRTRPFTKGVDKKILFYSVNSDVYLILILTYVIAVI